MTNVNAQRYVPLEWLRGSTEARLARLGTYLPLDADTEQRVLDELGRYDYTYVQLRDGNLVEIVKLYNHCGVLQVERGVEGTKARDFPCGTCLKFIITPDSIQNIVCQLESCEDQENTMYVGTPDIVANLTAIYGDADIDLPIHDEHKAKLLSSLADGDNTTLKITDGYNTELVSVTNSGGTLIVERGQGGTKPVTFPVGSEVTWQLTVQAVKDIICQMECCPDTEDTETT